MSGDPLLLALADSSQVGIITATLPSSFEDDVVKKMYGEHAL